MSDMGAADALEREAVIDKVEYHVWQDGAIISLGGTATKEDVDFIRNWWEQVEEGSQLPTIIAGAPFEVIEHAGTFRGKETVVMTDRLRDSIYDLFLGE